MSPDGGLRAVEAAFRWLRVACCFDRGTGELVKPMLRRNRQGLLYSRCLTPTESCFELPLDDSKIFRACRVDSLQESFCCCII